VVYFFYFSASFLTILWNLKCSYIWSFLAKLFKASLYQILQKDSAQCDWNNMLLKRPFSRYLALSLTFRSTDSWWADKNDRNDNACINSNKSLTFRSAIFARTREAHPNVQMPSGYFPRWRKGKMATMSNFPTVGMTYDQNPYPGGITYDQNPYPGDSAHDQNPVVSPTPPPRA